MRDFIHLCAVLFQVFGGVAFVVAFGAVLFKADPPEWAAWGFLAFLAVAVVYRLPTGRYFNPIDDEAKK